MRLAWFTLVLVLVLSACASDGKDSAGRGASCAERVATLAAHLASPRPIAEVRTTASPQLREDLAAIEAEPDEAARATHAARRMQPLVADCPAVVAVFGEVATIEHKDAHLRARVPAAIEACACKASPEDVGGLLEVVLGGWDGPPSRFTE